MGAITVRPSKKPILSAVCVPFTLVACPPAAMAQALENADSEAGNLRDEVRAQAERIEQLEDMLRHQGALIEELRQRAIPPQAAQPPLAAQSAISAASIPRAVPSLHSGVVRLAEDHAETSKWMVHGDVRIRQEINPANSLAPQRWRTVVRGRLGASYKATPELTLGARLVTGDSDDPNSSDATLGSFVDDLPVALDQLWLRYSTGGVTIHAGKFPPIFQRTDLVWDGDVMPQGIGVSYATAQDAAIAVEGSAIYFVIDEASAGADSYMLGGQVSARGTLGQDATARLAIGYYDYTLNQLAAADAGDFRGNRLLNGRYGSDFRLLDVIANVQLPLFGDAWPVEVTGNFVRNLGADDGLNDGMLLGVAIGRQASHGDWRFKYDYINAETDAVFAAFSHDNIALSTNYLMHAVTLQNRLTDALGMELNWYHYRALNNQFTDPSALGVWRDRVRANLMYQF